MLHRVLVFLITLALGGLTSCGNVPGAAPKNEAGSGELRLAAVGGDLGAVKALLKQNPDLVYIRDNNGWTPLHWAAVEGNKDMAQYLLSHKAQVDAIDSDGQTPLHLAALKGESGAAALLLAGNANVNSRDKDGFTPLHDALDQGHKAVAELLRAHGGHE